MTMATLPNGKPTYIGRRGRLSGALAAPPPPPGAVPYAAVAVRALEVSPLLLPAPVPLRVLSTKGSGQLYQQAGYIVGWCVNETSGSARAELQLFDGANASGQLVLSLGIAQGADDTCSVYPPGWTVTAGLYLSVASGAFDGVVWFLPTQQPGAAAPAAPGSASAA